MEKEIEALEPKLRELKRSLKGFRGEFEKVPGTIRSVGIVLKKFSGFWELFYSTVKTGEISPVGTLLSLLFRCVLTMPMLKPFISACPSTSSTPPFGALTGTKAKDLGSAFNVMNTTIETKVPERIEKVYQNLVLKPIETLILSHKQIQAQLAEWREHMKKFRFVGQELLV